MSAEAGSRKRACSAIDGNETLDDGTPRRPSDLSTGSNVLFRFVNEGDNSMTNKLKVTTLEDEQQSPNIGLSASYLALENETHADQKEIRETMKVGKGTGIAYPRHVKNYYEFMVTDQAARKSLDSQWTIIPPFPITAGTVALFLKHETTRFKKNSDGQLIPGSRVSFESIKQCITALENWRLTHEFDYRNNPDALRPLRQDNRIRTYEKNARESESKRIADAQLAKAYGSPL
ncbi:hypothetical protein H0H93_015690, partial [Arthromyces matolae]